MGEDGASQYNSEKRVRACEDYMTLKKSADWDMTGTVEERQIWFSPMEEYRDRNGLRFCIFDIPDLEDPATFVNTFAAAETAMSEATEDTGSESTTPGSEGGSTNTASDFP